MATLLHLSGARYAGLQCLLLHCYCSSHQASWGCVRSNDCCQKLGKQTCNHRCARLAGRLRKARSGLRLSAVDWVCQVGLYVCFQVTQPFFKLVLLLLKSGYLPKGHHGKLVLLIRLVQQSTITCFTKCERWLHWTCCDNNRVNMPIMLLISCRVLAWMEAHISLLFSSNTYA